jgi:hypothetical protein
VRIIAVSRLEVALFAITPPFYSTAALVAKMRVARCQPVLGLRDGRYGLVWYTAVGRHECAVREGQLSRGHSPEFDFGAFPVQNLGSHSMKIDTKIQIL